MLFLAGLIEGIFRQAVNDVPVRYALATLTASLWIVYFVFVGQEEMMNVTTPRHTLRIETPEGVVVNLVRGSAADRAVAFVIDMGILLAAIIAMMVVSSYLGSMWVLAFFISLTFLLRIFYFVVCEAGRRGATIGKRLMKLRVVRTDGGQLTIDAVLTRNFTRELEIFLPLTFLFAHEQFWVGHSS